MAKEGPEEPPTRAWFSASQPASEAQSNHRVSSGTEKWVTPQKADTSKGLAWTESGNFIMVSVEWGWAFGLG